MQRTLIGVTRDGGTVYKNYADLKSAKTTSHSTSAGSVPSAHKLISVSEGIQMRMKSLEAPSGRLEYFYHGLHVPKRNVPWSEITEHTTVPFSHMNPQYFSDISRHTTVNRCLGIDGVPDMSIAHVADKYRKVAGELFNKTVYRDNAVQQSHRNKLRERIAADLDMKRVAFKSAALEDYHDRVNGKVCHVT
jgi:hypothetical protein